MTADAAKGASGGAANESGAEYRRGVAAFFVAHGLSGQPVTGIDVPSPNAVPIAVSLETDEPIDDVGVDLSSGYSLMIQAKRSIRTREVLRAAVKQWVKAARWSGFDPSHQRIVLCAGSLGRQASLVQAVLDRERHGHGGGRTKEEAAAMRLVEDDLAELSASEMAAVTRAAVILELFVEKDHLPDSLVGRSLLEAHVVLAGEGIHAWRDLMRIAGGMAQLRTGADMRQWRMALRDAGNHLVPEKLRVANKVPRGLPPAPQNFVNRQAELARLSKLRKEAENAVGPVIALLHGQRGVGKTALAKQWAAKNQEWFIGGSLHGDFSNRTEAGASDPSEVLAGFLEELGVSEWEIPREYEDRLRCFWDKTSSRKLLVFLDAVANTAEVKPLIPTGPGSMVIVTSNHRLPGLLEGGRPPLSVRPLKTGSAQGLLASMIGPERAGAEPAAIAELVAICAGLPVALCVCGGHLAYRETLTPSKLVAQIRKQPKALFSLAGAGERSAMEVFEFAYGELATRAAAMYRALGIHAGRTITTDVAAVLADVTVDEAERALEILYEAHLVDITVDDRYQMHSLIRHHAGIVAQRDEPPTVIEAAMHRVVDWYFETAHKADVTLVQERTRAASDFVRSSVPVPDFRSKDDVYEWFESERATLPAILKVAWDLGRYDRVWGIVQALWNPYSTRRSYSEWIETHELAIKSAVRSGNAAAEAQMRKQISRAHAESGDSGRAREELRLAYSAAKKSGNRMVIATVIEFRGTFLVGVGEYTAALRDFRRARALFQEIDFPRGVAMQDLLIGAVMVQKGKPKLALEPLETSLGVMVRLGDDFSIARVQLWLGGALKDLDQIDRAAGVLDDAIEILARYGLRLEEAQALETRAEVADLQSAHEEAYEHRYSAYEIYLELDHPRASGLASQLRTTALGSSAG